MNKHQLDSNDASILVVDDTPANLRLLVNLLVEQGYDVRPALNGHRALLSATAKPPDLILLDIMMPDIDGYEVCRLLKADERTCDIPIIFISALDQVLDKVKAFSTGAVDYVSKPFQIEEVLARVQTHLTICNLQKKQKRLNNQLEELVQARTAELVEANYHLKNEIRERKRAENEIEQRLMVREMVLETLSQQVADRTQEMTAFFDVDMLASEWQDIQEILEPIIGKIMEVGRCQAVSIHLLTEQQPSLRLITQQGIPPTCMPALDIIEQQDPFAKWISKPNPPIMTSLLDSGNASTFDNSQTLLFDSAQKSTFSSAEYAPIMPFELQETGFTSYLGAQLRARGKPLGILSCFRGSEAPFSLKNEVPIVTALAEQLGVIVENHRLRQQIKKMAVIEERQRLARELHDSVTQSLYSLRLLTNGWQTMAEQGLLKMSQVPDCFNQLGEVAKQVLKEMRLLLHQLRSPLLSEMGLVGALQHRLEAVEQRASIETRLLTHGDIDHLPSKMEEQLFHIAQEALNNSLRHAKATSLIICIQVKKDYLVLKIEDDGCGFDPTSNSAGMGLHTIQERAQLIGGQLSIMSTPQRGTIVEIRVQRT